MANFVRITMGTGDTTVHLSSVVDYAVFPQQGGIVLIGTERIKYTIAGRHALTGCTRAANGTTAATHAVGAPVTLVEALPLTPAVTSLSSTALADPSGTLTADQVDGVDALICTTTGAKSITLPTPTSSAVRLLRVINVTASAGAVTCNSTSIAAGSGKSYCWDGTEWVLC